MNKTQTSDKKTTPDTSTTLKEIASAPAASAQALASTALTGSPDANAHPIAPLLSSDPNPKVANPLHHVKAHLTVRVGTAELSVGELLGAHEQQVLRLDRRVDEPIDLVLEGHVVARGVLVAVGDFFGVRIVELPRPLTP